MLHHTSRPHAEHKQASLASVLKILLTRHIKQCTLLRTLTKGPHRYLQHKCKLQPISPFPEEVDEHRHQLMKERKKILTVCGNLIIYLSG